MCSKIVTNFQIDQEAPCALCGMESPDTTIDIKLQAPKQWSTQYEKLDYSGLLVHADCKERYQRQSLFANSLLAVSLLGLFLGWLLSKLSGEVGGLFIFIGVVCLFVWVFFWRSLNRRTYKKVSSWAKQNVLFSLGMMHL